MYEVEIKHLKKSQAVKFEKHLKEEHPKYSRHTEIEPEKEKRKHGCKNTVWTGEY